MIFFSTNQKMLIQKTYSLAVHLLSNIPFYFDVCEGQKNIFTFPLSLANVVFVTSQVSYFTHIYRVWHDEVLLDCYGKAFTMEFLNNNI